MTEMGRGHRRRGKREGEIRVGRGGERAEDDWREMEQKMGSGDEQCDREGEIRQRWS